MGKKTVDDYLTSGMYGVRRPKEHERKYFLGTLRERLALALTVGEVMSDNGVKQLEQAMIEHPKAKLIMNGHIAGKFLKEEKELARKYNIAYSIVSNEENKTNIGAVLTYDYAINKEKVFINEIETEDGTDNTDKLAHNQKSNSFLSKIKKWFN